MSYPKTVKAWFNPSVFAPPAPGTWGNLPFDALRAPGRQNWTLSLFKEFVINEARGSRVEFRAESFNTWNHTQFGGSGQNGGISTNLGASNFGAVTAAFDPRVFQLGLKLIYQVPATNEPRSSKGMLRMCNFSRWLIATCTCPSGSHGKASMLAY